MKLKPLEDHVVIKMLEVEKKTKSGIILSVGARETNDMAEIIAVGPGKYIDGKYAGMMIEPGQTVIVSKYAGAHIKINGKDLIIVRQQDILTIVED